jgi:hypothetical protein
MILAIFLQAANCLFEAAGSVPDIEGCGFLAGGFTLSAVTFTTLAILVTKNLCRLLPQPGRAVGRRREGVAMGLTGAALYMSGGIVLAFARGHVEALVPVVGAWSTLLIAFCGAGGWIGGILAETANGPVAWRDSGS